jgi:opacity protein-like surface antigen
LQKHGKHILALAGKEECITLKRARPAKSLNKKGEILILKIYCNMKKFFLLVVVAVMTASFAQAQVKFGARAGFNLTNVTEKYDGKAVDSDEKGSFKPGFQIGVVADIALADALSLQPGLLFATQGCTYKGEDGDEDLKINLNYIQIPINVQYKLDLGGNSLLLQAGPYLGYAIGGKWKAGSESEDVKFGSKDEEIKAFDFGIGLGVGMQFSNLQVGLGYNLGLANLNNAEKMTSKNNGLAVTVTFLFGN